MILKTWKQILLSTLVTLSLITSTILSANEKPYPNILEIENRVNRTSADNPKQVRENLALLTELMKNHPSDTQLMQLAAIFF